MATSYAGLPNKLVSAPGGADYAYREMGEGEVPLVLFQHFPTEHTYRLAAALAASGVPHAVHVFAHGPHSLGLAQGAGEAAIWTTLASAWIREQGSSRRWSSAPPRARSSWPHTASGHSMRPDPCRASRPGWPAGRSAPR